MTKATKAKNLEEWDIDKLVPYENNAKIHTKAQIDKIAASIKQHGLINPPNVERDGTIISGHGRWQALKQLGWKTLPVFVRYDLSAIEAKAARIADNKVAEGDINTNVLQEELRWLERESYDDLTILGFDDRELAFLTEDIGELDEDLLAGDLDLPLLPEDGEAATSEDSLTVADEAMVPVVKALGFTQITTSQSRALKRFIAVLESKFECDPAEALVAHIDEELNHE